jgi:hypothetical protein
LSVLRGSGEQLNEARTSGSVQEIPRKHLILLMEATTRIELVYTVLQTVA